MRPGRGSTMVECTISTRVDGDVLKVFWSYCSELALLKSPVIINAASGVRGFLLTYIPVQLCVGLRRNVNSRDYDRCKIPR